MRTLHSKSSHTHVYACTNYIYANISSCIWTRTRTVNYCQLRNILCLAITSQLNEYILYQTILLAYMTCNSLCQYVCVRGLMIVCAKSS